MTDGSTGHNKMHVRMKLHRITPPRVQHAEEAKAGHSDGCVFFAGFSHLWTRHGSILQVP
jgi:hypothetical protein